MHGISYAEVLIEPGTSIESISSISDVSISVSEEQKRVVKSYESSDPLSYMLDIKLVEKNEYEPQEWIWKNLKNYGTVIYPIYVHFINVNDKTINNYSGKITIDLPTDVKNPSMFLLETNENVREINFKINKETDTVSFDVDQNDCCFVLVDKIVKQEPKKSTKILKSASVRRKSSNFQYAKQKRTSDSCLTLSEILCSPWILISSLFWYEDSRKKRLNKARRYRKYRKGTRYIHHRYLKYKGARYK